MFKLGCATLVLVFTAPVRSAAPVRGQAPLEAASITLEYNAAEDSAALVVEAESDEPLRRFRLVAPDGSLLLDLSGHPSQGLSLSGLRLESETPALEALCAEHPEGIYEFQAQASDGGPIVGSARLSHELARPVELHFPGDGFVAVPTTGLLLSWTGDAAAAGYEVGLEQGENDGLRIRLPPGSTSFLVPDGFLAPATSTQLEIATLAENGNRTIAVIEFTTQ